jgi:hypothetical protein
MCGPGMRDFPSARCRREAHAQCDPLVPELAGGVLGRADQGGADSLSPEWPEDLQVVEPGHPGKLPADLGLVGWLALQRFSLAIRWSPST